MPAVWPFVARSSQVQQLRTAVRSAGGVVVCGEAGVGKSRLLTEALRGLPSLRIVRATGTRAAAGIPFGALAHELPDRPVAADGYANLLRWAADALVAPGPCVVAVDDAHLLDSPSAALIHYLAVHSMARVVATVRSAAPTPDAITALWKDELVTRMDLLPLVEDETEELLTGVLGGPVQPTTVHRLFQASRGNALYLRELVIDAQSRGALAVADGAWTWRGHLSVSPSLRDLVHARIGDVDDQERTVLELVALGEPIGAGLLTDLGLGEHLQRVERRQLIAATRHERRLDVRMAHPLYGEVVREQCGPTRTAAAWQTLAQVVERTGGRRREDAIRIAVWRLDSGTATEPERLIAAATLAWSSYEVELAARLLHAAVAAGAGPAAANQLGFLLFHLGRYEESVAILSAVAPRLESDADRADHVQALAVNTGCGLGRYEDACRLVASAEAAVSDVGWRQCILNTGAVVHFFAGRTGPALATLARAEALGPRGDRARAEAWAIEAWARAHRAETGASLALIDEALAAQDSWREYAGYVRPTLLDARCNAHLFAGAVPAAEASADEALRFADRWANWDMAVVAFTTYHAQAARMRGDARGALRRCRDVTSHLRGWNTNVPRCLSELAHAAALLGDLATAEQASAEAHERLGPGTGNWATAVDVNTAWVAVAQGDVDRAVKELVAASERCADLELFGYMIFALHDVVRLGRASLVVERLRTLSTRVDSPLATVCARHAAAAADQAGPDLLAVADTFERMGLILYAAEAAAQAGAALRRAGAASPARAAEARSWVLAGRCPGVTTPALVQLRAPALTARQLQIARFAARGDSNRQIAERLVLSVRTVENHLRVVYEKLSVTDRTMLADLLARGG